MNTGRYPSAAREEEIKSIVLRHALTEEAVDDESRINDAPPQVVVETEVIWLQVNQ